MLIENFSYFSDYKFVISYMRSSKASFLAFVLNNSFLVKKIFACDAKNEITASGDS